MPFLQLRDNKTEAAEEQERDKGENESSNDAGHLGSERRDAMTGAEV